MDLEEYGKLRELVKQITGEIIERNGSKIHGTEHYNLIYQIRGEIITCVMLAITSAEASKIR